MGHRFICNRCGDVALQNEATLAGKKEGKPWDWIYQKFPSRTHLAVRTRWTRVRSRTEWASSHTIKLPSTPGQAAAEDMCAYLLRTNIRPHPSTSQSQRGSTILSMDGNGTPGKAKEGVRCIGRISSQNIMGRLSLEADMRRVVYMENNPCGILEFAHSLISLVSLVSLYCTVHVQLP